MNTTTIGKRAEQTAAEYLERKGYRIIDRNWRTRWCEIDLVAIKGGAVSFVEVKYRRKTTWGRGLEYITRTKHGQMSFAAEFWVLKHDWKGQMYLAVVEVTGADYTVTAFIPEL